MERINWKTFVIELIFFILALGIGVFIAPLVAEGFAAAAEADTGREVSSMHPITFIVYFLFATLVVYFVSKSERLEKSRLFFFKFAFLFSCLLGSFITFSVLVDELLALTVSLFLVFVWHRKPIILIHNLLIAFAIAGIGAIVGGMFTPPVVVVLLVVFSVYDVIAVYKTKHMVKMATEMIKTRAIMGLIATFKFKDLLRSLDQKKKKEFMVLGGGDLAFPLFLVSSVSLHHGIKEAVIISGFVCLGLLGSFLFFLFQRTKRPIPALPPIALFSTLGYLAVHLFI